MAAPSFFLCLIPASAILSRALSRFSHDGLDIVPALVPGCPNEINLSRFSPISKRLIGNAELPGGFLRRKIFHNPCALLLAFAAFISYFHLLWQETFRAGGQAVREQGPETQKDQQRLAFLFSASSFFGVVAP